MIPLHNIDGELTSQWEGEWIEKAGYLKLDCLGLSLLDKINKMCELIGIEDIDEYLENIDLKDEKVLKLFRLGYTEDIFQFNAPGLSKYCKKLHPDTFEHLVAATSLYRPGVMESNLHLEFIEYKNGKSPKYDVGMEEITKDTFGILVYQEQVMKALMVGGLSTVEADMARIAIKKKDHNKMRSFKDKFIHNYSKISNNANEVWKNILAFSTYSFNRAHAVAYTLMSYYQMHFKVHFPVQFYTVSFNYSTESVLPFRINEMKRLCKKITLKNCDINRSDEEFTYEGNTIFFNFNKLKGIGITKSSAIIEDREKNGGQYFSLEEFMRRKVIGKTNVLTLIYAGSFDELEEIKSLKDRARLISIYDNYHKTKTIIEPTEYFFRKKEREVSFDDTITRDNYKKRNYAE